MNKKKLLIVAHHLTIGGAQKSLIAALKVIDYEKFDVTLYLRKNRTDLLPLVDERVNVIINDDKHHYYRRPYAVFLQILIAIFSALGKKEKAQKFNQKLSDAIVKYSMDYEKKQFFSSEKYDIAIAYVQGYAALLVSECVMADKKIVFFHTSTDDMHSLHEKILVDFQNILVEHDSQKVLLEKWFPSHKNKIYIIENYVDQDMLFEQSKEKVVEKTLDKTVLCYCGRFAKVKGFDLAVETAKILKENNISFVWYFVGDGPERANLEKLIENYNLQKEIIITGMQKNPYPYINDCDIYVQASYEENTGITILEAHRLNKPVISTKTLGGTKLIENFKNGLLSEINANSLADNIMMLINDRQLMEDITDNLKSKSYKDELDKHRSEWQNLLEG